MYLRKDGGTDCRKRDESGKYNDSPEGNIF